MPRTALRTATVLTAVLLTAGCGGKAATTPPAAPDSASPGLATPTGGTPVPTSATPAPADIEGCSWAEEPNPTTFAVPARGLSQPVVGVGLDNEGNVGAPPDKFSVAWWTAGPKVGSDRGHVILTVHTWTGDVALGNILENPSNGLHPGDVIRLSDGSKTVCYRYTDTKKIKVADYDRSSTVWINPDGDPKLTIMICADYNARTGEWDSRHVFYADPIKP